MEPTFRVGDLAVYPAHGVAQIVGIETREISGNKQTFYILKILENGMKIMIPTRNAGAVGLRELIRADEVDEVFAILKSREVAVEGQTWNRRYREYMEKIKTGSVFEIAEVLRDLQRLKGDKELSFGERKMLDTARTLLIKEIAVATKSKEVKIEEKLDRIFACVIVLRAVEALSTPARRQPAGVFFVLGVAQLRAARGRSLLVPESGHAKRRRQCPPCPNRKCPPTARKFLEETTMQLHLRDPRGSARRRDGDGLPALSGRPLPEVEVLCRGLIAADHKYWWSYSLYAATLRRLGRLQRGRSSSSRRASSTSPTSRSCC